MYLQAFKYGQDVCPPALERLAGLCCLAHLGLHLPYPVVQDCHLPIRTLQRRPHVLQSGKFSRSKFVGHMQDNLRQNQT